MNPFIMIAGIGILLFAKRRQHRDRAANAKMDELLKHHKQALREGRLLMYQID